MHEEAAARGERGEADERTSSDRARSAADLSAALNEEASAAQADARLRIERARRSVEDAQALTPRQREVLALSAVGYTPREISGRLGLTVSAVMSYRADGMGRLGVTSVAEVVAWALHNGHLLPEGEDWTSERFLATVEHAPLMVLVADAEMRFRDASGAALDELGYSRDELLRLSVADIVLDREDAERRYSSYLMIGVQHGTITLRRKDRSTFEASYAATTRHVLEVAYYVSVLIPA